MVSGGYTRAELLRRAGLAAAAVGATPYSFAGPLRYGGRELRGELSIVQWSHVVPEYDAWFDDEWAAAWGRQHDVEVSVDHVASTRLPALAAAEARAQKGHDLFGFLSPPAAYEDQVIDHAAIVAEIERRVGPSSELGRRSTFNPRTGKWFGVSDSFVPAPLIWRHDLWNAAGESPATWDHVRAAAPTLKAAGHPIGIGQSRDLDSNIALISFLLGFGARIQDEDGNLAIDSRDTVQAVQFMADLYRSGEEPVVFDWTPASNNQYVFSGKGSLIQNAISAVRTAENLDFPFANELWIWPLPAGPAGRLGVGQMTGVYAVWKFAKNADVAERFLVDLCAGFEQATLASQLFNFPSFPGAFPARRLYKAAAADTHRPRGKYTILASVASKYTCNLGYPGYSNAAVDEACSKFLIPQMFAQVSQGKLTAAESVRATAAQMKQIWGKWRSAGKI